jgi:hypothetical protein
MNVTLYSNKYILQNIIIGNTHMSIARVEWDASSEKHAGLNVIQLFTDIDLDRKAGIDITWGRWQGAIKQLKDHMINMRAEEFLDGPNGRFIGPLVTALGGDPSTIPVPTP